jgi:hypothetical protein
MNAFEHAGRHGLSSLLTFVTAIASWAAVAVGQIASDPTPVGITHAQWLLVGGLSTTLLTISKGAQAVSTIISQGAPTPDPVVTPEPDPAAAPAAPVA